MAWNEWHTTLSCSVASMLVTQLMCTVALTSRKMRKLFCAQCARDAAAISATLQCLTNAFPPVTTRSPGRWPIMLRVIYALA